MRRFHWIILAALLPVQAFAQDAVIRLEAKRGVDAVELAAQNWGQKFDNVVTFPLSGGWTAIAVGPFPSEDAADMLADLKAQQKVPADSFVAVLQDDVSLTAVQPGQTAEPEAGPSAGTISVPPAGMEIGAMSAPSPDVMAPDRFLRLEAFQDRSDADGALAKWREIHPEAGLWQLPSGWFAIALGPLADEAASAWLKLFKTAGQAPKDALVSTTSEMGTNVTTGKTPDLPAPPAEPAALPDAEQMQRALRWAGVYDGAIDGKPGPKTQSAVTEVIIAERLSTDPGTAMTQLVQKRDDWRKDMGLSELTDEHTGLAVSAPMERLVFDRTERALSIYGPKDGSGAALILFSQMGGQQELLDLSGLVTALGWVPQPERTIERGHVLLSGQNSDHIGLAEGWVRDGRAEGFVLIWPASDGDNQQRIAAEISDTLTRQGPARSEVVEGDPSEDSVEPSEASPNPLEAAAQP